MSAPVECLPVKRVAEVEEVRGTRWLVDTLWPQQGVGFLCGSPKSCKTWLALDLALSVATKTAALGCYEAKDQGPVLLFAAEDAPVMVRERLAGMARQRGLDLSQVPVQLVLASSLQLETRRDQARLKATVERCQPKLLVLDPFVRLSTADENSAHEVSAVLGYLRQLQRSHEVAIVVVHHTRKQTAKGTPAGLALRGSGDFWAWADTTLHLRRHNEALHLVSEHRSAASVEPVMLELCDPDNTGPYLRIADGMPAENASATASIAERILDALRTHGEPKKLEALRADLRVRMQSVVDTLRELERDRRVKRVARGWDLVPATGATITSTNHKPGQTEAGSAEEQPAKG